MVALSEIDDEYEEMLLKATSVLTAIGHQRRPGQLGPQGSESATQNGAHAQTSGASLQDTSGEKRAARENAPQEFVPPNTIAQKVVPHENAPPRNGRGVDGRRSALGTASPVGMRRGKRRMTRNSKLIVPRAVGQDRENATGDGTSPELRSDLGDDLAQGR